MLGIAVSRFFAILEMENPSELLTSCIMILNLDSFPSSQNKFFVLSLYDTIAIKTLLHLDNNVTLTIYDSGQFESQKSHLPRIPLYLESQYLCVILPHKEH